MATTDGIAEMNALNSEVIDALNTYGDVIYIYKRLNSNSTDSDGNPVILTYPVVESVGFAYNNKLYSLNLLRSSVINDSETNMILKADIELEKDDIITHFGNQYKILDLQRYSGAGIKIAYEVILGKSTEIISEDDLS